MVCLLVQWVEVSTDSEGKELGAQMVRVRYVNKRTPVSSSWSYAPPGGLGSHNPLYSHPQSSITRGTHSRPLLILLRTVSWPA